jgi:hypothetical protein
MLSGFSPTVFSRRLLCIAAVAAFLVGLAGCKKTEIREINEVYILEGNNPPDYSGVTSLQVQNYVGRLYVDILGEQPSLEVINEQSAALLAAGLSTQARELLISSIMDDEEYFSNLWNYTAVQMINGVPRTEIEEQIAVCEFVIEQYYQLGEIQLAQYLELENQKLTDLLNAETELYEESISINEFYRRFCFNAIYDEINMGSENMVIACFENLFSRYPTLSELELGVLMVDGLSSILFQQSGSSKGDFVDIVTQTPEFYGGRVLEQYQRLLQRQPTPFEQDEGAQLLSESGSLKVLQISILSTDEYAGF